MRRSALLTMALAVLGMPSSVLAQQAVPSAHTLSSGWEMRVEAAAPAPPQPAPPEETEPDSEGASVAMTPPGRAAQSDGPWQATHVPSVFDSRALPQLYPGTVRRYRTTFVGPATPRGFSWLIRFDSVRRNAAVILNGRRIGRNVDPYTPFTVPARGLRPGRRNVLEVIVDGRKNPQLPEAWWNWNGIVRPVHLEPAGPAHIEDLGTMSRVRCKGPGAALPGRSAPRRHARAARRPGDPAVARRAAARPRRPRDRADVPPAGPDRAAAADEAVDAGARAGAVVARLAPALRRRVHAPERRPGGAARAAGRRAALGPGEGAATSG